jgi:glycosidase
MKTRRALALLALLAPLSVLACSASGTGDGADVDPLPQRDAGNDASPPLSSALDAAQPAPPLASEPFSVWRQREPIYELYVRHFSKAGNFKGVEEKLPELAALGVGIVWLLPINEIGSIVAANGGQAIDAPHGNPYAVKRYEQVNAEYGSDGTTASAEADLVSLVKRAHQLGMHVIVDWVPNHTAWDSPLIAAHPDWYKRAGGAIQPVSEFPWIAQLDWSNPELHAYMTGVMRSWVEKFDIDGFRVDYAHGMPVPFFAALRQELEKVKPVFLLAESGDVAFHPAFDMTYDWNVYPLFGDVAHGSRTVSAIDDALLNTQLIPYAPTPDALVMRMTYNHDDNGKFTLAERYEGGIKTFAVLAATLPGKPLVFDGQEVGMNVFDGTTVRPSINLGHDPAVKIDWSDPEGYRPFYTKLLHLFRANPALHHAGGGDFRKVDTTPSSYPYAFVRRDGANTVLVILNLSAADLPAVVLAPQANAGTIDGDYTDLFTGAPARIEAGQSLHLGPWAYRVLVQGPTK